ncbi:tail fiber assembly protein [Pseudomonas rhodesiae]|uniref:tail fiber assembly protein n=1 Tax=Pseudomonas rhodesiae TaxID=76760 RepID=UPI000B8C4644|nr:tail fiber assembly protein [Pseudomonas rhodesiae]OXS23096.1 phage tail protein [Pseudomonas fluorescens]OZO47388.1 phage tail protein [Pseudomonas fluorescens]TGY19938.1 phage tail protein [Pseudomonas fluorescens]
MDNQADTPVTESFEVFYENPEPPQPEVIYYSARDCGFVFLSERPAYDTAGTWPEDAVEVTAEDWQAFGQTAPPPGMRRGSDDQGRPAWITPEVTPEDAQQQERAWRDRQLSATDSLVTRHRDELEANRLTTLTAEQYQALQRYRLDLRDWPTSASFPSAEQRPTAPAWLVDAHL